MLRSSQARKHRRNIKSSISTNQRMRKDESGKFINGHASHTDVPTQFCSQILLTFKMLKLDNMLAIASKKNALNNMFYDKGKKSYE